MCTVKRSAQQICGDFHWNGEQRRNVLQSHDQQEAKYHDGTTNPLILLAEKSRQLFRVFGQLECETRCQTCQRTYNQPHAAVLQFVHELDGSNHRISGNEPSDIEFFSCPDHCHHQHLRSDQYPSQFGKGLFICTFPGCFHIISPCRVRGFLQAGDSPKPPVPTEPTPFPAQTAPTCAHAARSQHTKW